VQIAEEEAEEAAESAAAEPQAAVADAEEDSSPAPASAPAPKPYVIGVTACPTGIAHTYMAAEALEKKGAELGIDIKIETNGSGGIKNALTADDIARAKGVIVACDKNVPIERFAGKPVVFVKVAAGIKEPERLIPRSPGRQGSHLPRERRRCPGRRERRSRGHSPGGRRRF
jgi:fructose PTS system EIIBC or EIIC component